MGCINRICVDLIRDGSESCGVFRLHRFETDIKSDYEREAFERKPGADLQLSKRIPGDPFCSHPLSAIARQADAHRAKVLSGDGKMRRTI